MSREQYIPVPDTSGYLAVLTAAASFATVMAAKEFWLFTTTTNCLIAQGASPTAAKAAGSTLVAAGQSMVIQGSRGAYLSVCRDTADGIATLTKIQFVR